MATYRVFRPTVDEPENLGDPLAQRRGSLDGKRIGLLWNSKVNADIYLRRLQELIEARNKDVEFVFRAKPTASKPMEPEVVEAMQGCDLVVTAFGD
ncbi:MAG: hypothetical protein M3400_14765 [Actinomycetota bacterium]|nr:hypothetical protein [Actinomycetota bacterium]MDQ3735230.1 hypothetical protein [Actinomycetota bacterium]